MIVGITGLAGSGKDTVADVLVRDYGFAKVALADPMKRFLKELMGFTDEQLWGPNEKRNAVDPRYLWGGGRHRMSSTSPFACERCGELFTSALCGLSPRFALQRLGTEWGRDCYVDVWIDYALRIADVLLAPRDPQALLCPYYSAAEGVRYHADRRPSPAGVVVSDVRFPNEARAIHVRGGVIWRTTRGQGLAGHAGQHESERYARELEVDATVPHDLSLAELPSAVCNLLAATARAVRTVNG